MNTQKRNGVIVVIFLAASLLSPLALAGIPLAVYANPAVIRVPADYSTIQAAVDAASPGDTIIVSSNTYFENVMITKSLNLYGESTGTVIIDGSNSGPGINITSTSTVSVANFTIRNTGFFYSGIIVYFSSEVQIYRNDIRASIEANG